MKKVIFLLAILLVLPKISFSGMMPLTYASSIYDYELGPGSTDPARTNPENALGEPDDLFLSLGEGGWIILEFDFPFTANAIVFETTYGNRENWLETADVFVAKEPEDFEFVAEINNLFPGTIINLPNSTFNYLKIVDTTLLNDGHPGDGFDLNSVAVATTPVPEPATMLLFGTGLAGLAGALRKRKK